MINFRNGTVYLDFDRKALSLEDAVMSAIKDVESSSVSAIVASLATENLVTESEIAEHSNYKRQAKLLGKICLKNLKAINSHLMSQNR